MSEAPPQLFDSHCHLGHHDVDDGTGEEAARAATLLARARTAGVAECLDVGIDAASSAAARDRAADHPGVYWSAGLHPCGADRFEADWGALRDLATGPDRCAALGETGFDFHWHPDGRAVQQRAFEAHLQLAVDTALPVIIHCRDAFDATFEVLAAWPGVTSIVHCFSGGPAEAERALTLGCHLSFAGPLTYPRNDALREAAALTPTDRALIETDAPFLPPRSRRGKRNEPAFVAETLATLAQLQGVDLATAAARTTANARRLFAAGAR